MAGSDLVSAYKCQLMEVSLYFVCNKTSMLYSSLNRTTYFEPSKPSHFARYYIEKQDSDDRNIDLTNELVR